MFEYSNHNRKFSVGSGKPETTLVNVALSFLNTPIQDLLDTDTQFGWLACAKYVSIVLKETKQIDKIFIGVDALVDELVLRRGWEKVSAPVPGGIVVWGKTAIYSHKHIGIVVNATEAMNNSSFQKMPIKSKIYDDDQRPVEAFYTRPWIVTRYYTPVPNQRRYYGKSFEQDFKINCQGDCLVTASGYRLSQKDEFKIAACPKELKFGTVIELKGIGKVTCQDRGRAIKNHRIDVWAGIGDRGVDNIRNS